MAARPLMLSVMGASISLNTADHARQSRPRSCDAHHEIGD
jgi:hypothetical protein